MVLDFPHSSTKQALNIDYSSLVKRMCLQCDYIFIPVLFFISSFIFMKVLPLPELRLVYDNHATADNVTQSMRSPVRTILTDREACDELQCRIPPSLYSSILPSVHPSLSLPPSCLEQNCFQRKDV